MWPNTVQTLFDYDNVEAQVRNKVEEIAQDPKRGDHGPVMLTDKRTCLHWRAGNYRIFGVIEGPNFHFIGYGTHIGQGNSRYKVELETGHPSKAMTE